MGARIDAQFLDGTDHAERLGWRGGRLQGTKVMADLVAVVIDQVPEMIDQPAASRADWQRRPRFLQAIIERLQRAVGEQIGAEDDIGDVVVDDAHASILAIEDGARRRQPATIDEHGRPAASQARSLVGVPACSWR